MAILNHDNKLLKELLVLNYDPNSACCSCMTLKFPIVTKYSDWRQFLPETLEHISPLHVAVLSNNLDAVKILLRSRPDCKQIKINQVTQTGELTALHLAIFIKNPSIIEALIQGYVSSFLP